MSYDRKLKNAVSKSIIELLHREGLTLKWQMADHALANASLKTRQADHIGSRKIKENLHGDALVAMAAALFGGEAEVNDDVRAIDPDRIDWGAAQNTRKRQRKSVGRMGDKPRSSRSKG